MRGWLNHTKVTLNVMTDGSVELYASKVGAAVQRVVGTWPLWLVNTNDDASAIRGWVFPEESPCANASWNYACSLSICCWENNWLADIPSDLSSCQGKLIPVILHVRIIAWRTWDEVGHELDLLCNVEAMILGIQQALDTEH